VSAARAIAIAAALSVALGACAPNRGAAFEKSVAEARRAYGAGRFEEAALRYDEAARTAKVPRDAIFARYEAALARARAGDLPRAEAELRALATASPPNAYSAQAAFRAAMLTLATDPDAGYRELEDVVTRFPEDGVAEVAVTKLARHDDEAGPDRALAHLDRLAARVRTPDGKSGTEQTIAYERAKRLDALGRTEQARDAYLAVAARWPYPFGSYFDDSLYRASEMDEKLGRYREAIADLERLLSFREEASFMGSYERPKYVPAILRVAKLYEERLGDRARAREALHRLYTDFEHSTLRDDALWREAELWREDGDQTTACDRLATLASDFPDSKYVPCATERCPSIKRPSKSKAPPTCHAYIERTPAPAPRTP
jgi:outer membrane protein assembly factor BamD (BamD/ComL family)